eukprot:m.71329 g.71329  ORF g.71329 m.71329 type:complete len:299 (+) comp50179_c0_seq1:111-1007(+)
MLDRISFFLGVITLVLSEFIFVAHPQHFQTWFVVIMPVLLCVRIPRYRRLKWTYFLFDFCYFDNLLCLLAVPLSNYPALTQLAFVYSNGPVAWAILAWGNSLVFHDWDKITTLFMHFFPILLTYCWRWQPTANQSICPDGVSECTLDLWSLLAVPLIGYCLWQALYLLKTEVLDRKELAGDQSLLTSTRWLVRKPNTMRSITYSVCRKLRIMDKAEELNSETWKAKAIFVATQFVFTFVTLLPNKILWDSQAIHLGFLMLCFLVAVWNGARYYIDVFTKAYIQALPADATLQTKQHQS